MDRAISKQDRNRVWAPESHVRAGVLATYYLSTLDAEAGINYQGNLGNLL